MSRLLCEGLVKRLDRVAAVDEASLAVGPGSWLAVLGPPGSGKSTLARLIVGLETPDRGEIFLDDRLLQSTRPAERRFGFLASAEALWPHLTIAENVGYALRVQGVPRRDRRKKVEEAMASVGVEAIADRKPAELDDLQRRRAELARALVDDPLVLVLDEPTGPLDPRNRPLFRDDLRRLRAESDRTTLVLTHHRDDAFALSDLLAVMDLGKIVQVGTPAEVYATPADAFVAQLLGPANLLQGQVAGTSTAGELFVRTPIGRLVGRLGSPSRPEPPIGTPVTVAIRPESIRLGPSLPTDANRFTATVERQSFQGALRALDLRGPGDWPLVASALHPQAPDLREGQSLTVAVSPEHVVVLLGRYATGPKAGEPSP
ncbi:ABC transporter ATP-binding protein [Tautonia sociabilis]|uniref:ABC transporter ATP-binding protein n=1 Tax=Tautonia sociabilis TaxID=2080755 RepID=A0A432MKE0_9BACT|nr:ABC transporter ATP-binding protein [Tautonia sociabilis]RUL87872.1 ABC transporter ATP-binding protein [Tautonia sociabilis]